MKNKKAIQLSVNFIVMLIIAIVVFGFGVSFLGKFFEGAAEMQKQLDQDTQKRIESLLSTGELIAIPINSRTLEVGQNYMFGMGILNILNKDERFNIYIKCTTAIDKAGGNLAGGVEDYCERPTNPDRKWTFEDDFNEDIQNNEQKTMELLFSVPKGTKPGTYIFTVTVRDSTNKIYDVPRKLYIKVK